MKPELDPAQTLAHWEEQEAQRRRTMLTSGVARAEQVAGLTGMQIFERMFAGELPYPPIGETLDFLLIEVEPGRSVFQGRPLLRHYNPLGTVHGGVIATLLDTAAGCTVHSTLPAGVGYTSLDLMTRFIKPVTIDSGLLRCEGGIISRGRRTAVAESHLYDGRGKLLAHATSTCLIFELPQA